VKKSKPLDTCCEQVEEGRNTKGREEVSAETEHKVM
jgi:hypothetical protein